MLLGSNFETTVVKNFTKGKKRSLLVKQ